ncbi:MAG: S8 family serine peptidase [Candidatus Cloacimonetes bacterium]|nr:S8 family serine peptidase [Candidatus Cloacimonadota bacterium]
MKSLLIILCLFCTSLYGQDVNRGNVTYQEGTLTIKVKEGWGEIPAQQGAVYFGIPSLDALVMELGISSIEKRFRYNPDKLRSDLPDLSRIYLLTFPSEYDIEDVIRSFSADPHIEYAEPVPVRYPADIPDDPLYSVMQHLPQIQAEQAWDIHHGEDGTEQVIVGIVDSSLEWYHPDLLDNVWQNLGEDADGDGHVLEYSGNEWIYDPGDINNFDDDGNGYDDDLIGWDFYSDDNDIDHDIPEDDHGTHCSGIAAGVTDNGIGISSISWNITVMLTKHSPGDIWLYYPFDGMIYCAENGAAIISNSWGGEGFSQAEYEVIEYVTGLGSIIVAAAHNNDNQIEIYPAAYPGVISVASVAGNDEKADYSNFGCWVDIAAPGGDMNVDGGILSTISDGSYGTICGTSMATPLVAGTMGLLKSYHPDWSVDQMITQIFGTADNINDLNLGYEYMLGSGRINAFRALDETNVAVNQELKLNLFDYAINDDSGNGILEAGESGTFDLVLRNFAHYVDSDNATFTLSCNNPEIEITDNTCWGSIPADDYFTLEDVFEVHVSEDAEFIFTEFVITTEADIPVVLGDEIIIEIPIAPSGILIWDAVENGLDFSGRFIHDFLSRADYDVYYSNQIPASLIGFDAVFLSAGNYGQILADSEYPENDKISVVHNYLLNGGKVYVDGCFFNAIEYNQYPEMQSLYSFFGLMDSSNLGNSNPISSLAGQPGTVCENMLFSDSHQFNNWYLDLLTPIAGGVPAFIEDNFGIVSVYNVNANGSRTFTLSYSLADLVDVDTFNSRTSLFCKIADHLEILPEEYLYPYISADVVCGSIPLEVHFMDISVSDEDNPIIAWEWDLDSDGIIDSEEQNPVWTYNEEDYYDVTITVYTASGCATTMFEDFIRINSGILVWEGIENGEDYSGCFIRDYLEQVAETVNYRTDFQYILDGFDAVFLSFGNYQGDNTLFSDAMANAICEYLENGGCVYLEGGDALGWDQNDNEVLLEFFGLSAIEDGSYNQIDHLEGQESAITEGMLFLDSNQPHNGYIDIFTPLPTAQTAFQESDYGIVAVQFEGTHQQKTFCFSYTLADLVDEEYPSTRENLLWEIASFFDLEMTPVADETITPVFSLAQNFPNPFNPETTISYFLPSSCAVELKIYNIKGQLVKTLIDDTVTAGNHTTVWCGDDNNQRKVPTGIYLYRLKTKDDVKIRKMTLIK